MRKPVLTGAFVVVALAGSPAVAGPGPASATTSPATGSAPAASAAESAPEATVAAGAAVARAEAATPETAAVPPVPPPFDVDETVPPLTATDVVQPMLKTIAALGVVLFLAWLTLHKGMGRLVERAQAGKRMRVIERVALDARRSLFLVEVDGKTLVVGGGDLVRLDAPLPASRDDVDVAAVRGAAFERVLASSQARSSSPSPSPSSSTVASPPSESA
jgi:flagellar protein FliO/FliZ